jgi:hypothetical protein
MTKNVSNKRITFHVMKILTFLDLVRILIKQKKQKDSILRDENLSLRT